MDKNGNYLGLCGEKERVTNASRKYIPLHLDSRSHWGICATATNVGTSMEVRSPVTKANPARLYAKQDHV